MTRGLFLFLVVLSQSNYCVGASTFNLAQALKNVTAPPYHCEEHRFCNFKGESFEALRTHVRTKHSDAPTKLCAVCGSYFIFFSLHRNECKEICKIPYDERKTAFGLLNTAHLRLKIYEGDPEKPSEESDPEEFSKKSESSSNCAVS